MSPRPGWPQVVLESREPHSLITLAEAGLGIAVVPSTVRFPSRAVRVVALLQDRKALGAWGGLAWDPHVHCRSPRRASWRTWPSTRLAAFQGGGSSDWVRICLQHWSTWSASRNGWDLVPALVASPTTRGARRWRP
jgi:hypothetical protein